MLCLFSGEAGGCAKKKGLARQTDLGLHQACAQSQNGWGMRPTDSWRTSVSVGVAGRRGEPGRKQLIRVGDWGASYLLICSHPPPLAAFPISENGNFILLDARPKNAVILGPSLSLVPDVPGI